MDVSLLPVPRAPPPSAALRRVPYDDWLDLHASDLEAMFQMLQGYVGGERGVSDSLMTQSHSVELGGNRRVYTTYNVEGIYADLCRYLYLHSLNAFDKPQAEI